MEAQGLYLAANKAGQAYLQQTHATEWSCPVRFDSSLRGNEAPTCSLARADPFGLEQKKKRRYQKELWAKPSEIITLCFFLSAKQDEEEEKKRLTETYFEGSPAAPQLRQRCRRPRVLSPQQPPGLRREAAPPQPLGAGSLSSLLPFYFVRMISLENEPFASTFALVTLELP